MFTKVVLNLQFCVVVKCGALEKITRHLMSKGSMVRPMCGDYLTDWKRGMDLIQTLG